MSNRQVMFTPQVKPGWVGWGVQGLHPSAQAFSRALQGWVTEFQVQGYATHRSVSDLGAAGGLGRRTMGMAWQGYDASGPATGPFLCRRLRMTPRQSWWTCLPLQEQDRGSPVKACDSTQATVTSNHSLSECDPGDRGHGGRTRG